MLKSVKKGAHKWARTGASAHSESSSSLELLALLSNHRNYLMWLPYAERSELNFSYKNSVSPDLILATALLKIPPVLSKSPFKKAIKIVLQYQYSSFNSNTPL